MKKILLLMTLPYDNSTSIAVLGGLAGEYRKRGLDVILAGLYGSNSDKPRMRLTGAGPVWGLGGSNPWPRASLGLISRQLAAIVPGVDFIHLHFIGRYNAAVEAAAQASEGFGIPMGITFQDYANPMFLPQDAWQKRLLEKILARASWVTALSLFSSRAITCDYPELRRRIQVVPNGFNPLEAASPRACLRRRPFVFCAARFFRYKGVDMLLMAWKDVCDQITDIDLVLCGAGPEENSYRMLAKCLGVASRVKFLGEVSRPRLWRLMRSCRFSVLPSRHEAFGIAALEAMSCGKAVLTVNQGPRDFIKNGASGMLIPAMKVEVLRDGLLSLLRDGSLRRRMAAEARRASKAYSWEKVAAAYLRLVPRNHKSKY